MTYKQIESCREIRLWIVQIIAPAAMTVGAIYVTNPQVRYFIKDRIGRFKSKFGREKREA